MSSRITTPRPAYTPSSLRTLAGKQGYPHLAISPRKPPPLVFLGYTGPGGMKKAYPELGSPGDYMYIYGEQKQLMGWRITDQL